MPSHLQTAELTTKPREASAPFIPGGASANHADSRTHALSAKVSDRAIKAPSFSGRKGSYPEVAYDVSLTTLVVNSADRQIRWVYLGPPDRLPRRAPKTAERDRERDERDQEADGSLSRLRHQVSALELSCRIPSHLSNEPFASTNIRRKPNVEKEKLQQVFQFSQGSILPRELLPGSGS